VSRTHGFGVVDLRTGPQSLQFKHLSGPATPHPINRGAGGAEPDPAIDSGRAQDPDPLNCQVDPTCRLELMAMLAWWAKMSSPYPANVFS